MTGVKQWSCKLAWMTTKKNTAHYEIHSLSSVWTSFKGLSVASHHLAWVSFSAFPGCFPRHSFYWYRRERHNLYSGKSVPSPACFSSQEISSHCSMAFELRVVLSPHTMQLLSEQMMLQPVQPHCCLELSMALDSSPVHGDTKHLFGLWKRERQGTLCQKAPWRAWSLVSQLHCKQPLKGTNLTWYMGVVLGYDCKMSPGPEGTHNLPAVQEGQTGERLSSAAQTKLVK